MISKIDWLSFSLPVDLEEDGGVGALTYSVGAAFDNFNDQLLHLLGLDGEVVPQKGRKPYSHAWTLPQGGLTLYAHPNLPHCLVEISGRGCEALAADGVLPHILRIVSSRATRVDIATDIPTDTTPVQFATLRDQGRFKSYSQVESASGSTYYVGAKTSDRYARVYRYNPPHERAHLLRVEVVSKGPQAKVVADMLTRQEPAALASEFGKIFGWASSAWQPDVQSDETLVSWRPERHKGKSVFWLHAQVIPAMLKLHREGDIDLKELWEEYIEPFL